MHLVRNKRLLRGGSVFLCAAVVCPQLAFSCVCVCVFVCVCARARMRVRVRPPRSTCECGCYKCAGGRLRLLHLWKVCAHVATACIREERQRPALLLLADDAHLGNLTKPGVVFVAILITRRHPHHLTNRASYHHLRRRTPCLDRALTNPNDLTPVTAYA